MPDFLFRIFAASPFGSAEKVLHCLADQPLQQFPLDLRPRTDLPGVLSAAEQRSAPFPLFSRLEGAPWQAETFLMFIVSYCELQIYEALVGIC
jgi:hypothetical protein